MSANKSRFVICLLAVLCSSALATTLPSGKGREFNFKEDSFSYINELSWKYVKDPVTGAAEQQKNEQKPDYHLHCFAMSRMTRQFFDYAQFEPRKAKLDDAAYRKAVDSIIRRTPEEAEKKGRVSIPGYANLRSFSTDKEALLKAASGSALKSFFQFSNWRMVFPFSREHQDKTARQFLAELKNHELPVIHMIRFSPFPITLIDHAVLIFSAEETSEGIRFRIYDPNNATRPGLLKYDFDDRSFALSDTSYFNDGEIDVYEIYGNELK